MRSESEIQLKKPTLKRSLRNMRYNGSFFFVFLSPSPMRSLDFFNWPNPSSSTMALWSTQPLTETSTRNLPGGKWLSACKADILTAICVLWLSGKCWSVNVSQPYWPPWPVTGIALPFFFTLMILFYISCRNVPVQLLGMYRQTRSRLIVTNYEVMKEENEHINVDLQAYHV
jgi:hypothetical protein